MRWKWVATAVIATAAVIALSARRQAAPAVAQKDRASYAVGVEMARDIERAGMGMDPAVVAKGFADALAGKVLMSEDELRATLVTVRSELKKQTLTAARAAAARRKAEGEAFLADNARKPGVVTLPSGLQYRVLTAGEGRTPTEADTVECHYRGTLVDGTEFDSSHRRGEPGRFQVAHVIPGWKEALKLMPVGSRWQLFVPPRLAYGSRGAGRAIPPDATLIFEVELLAIGAAAPTAGEAAKTAPAGTPRVASER